MALTVKEESPWQPEVASLLRQSESIAASLYPDERRQKLTPEAPAAAGMRFFVARNADMLAVGCCALIDMGDGTAELKRMIVGEQFRRQGVGIALLTAVEAAAKAEGIRAIRMEVGIRNVDGYELYRRGGYEERGPFGAHRMSPMSRFMEKRFSPIS